MGQQKMLPTQESGVNAGALTPFLRPLEFN